MLAVTLVRDKRTRHGFRAVKHCVRDDKEATAWALSLKNRCTTVISLFEYSDLVKDIFLEVKDYGKNN